MTEFEINKAVAEKLGIAHGCDMGTVITYGNSGYKSFDPCNNVEQAWEIMMKYNIHVTNYGDRFEAYSNRWVDDRCSHKKPLVAAMLCFLEM